MRHIWFPVLLLLSVGALAAASPRGLVFAARGWVHFLPAAGRAARLLAPGASPALSPDGRTVAFARATSPIEGPVALRTVTVRGTAPRRLALLEGRIDSLCWSPDGGRLAFVQRQGATARLCTLRANTRELMTVLEAGDRVPDLYAPVWAADGRSLYVHDLRALYRVDLRGQVRWRRPLASIAGSATAVSSGDAFAPDPANPLLVAFTRAVPGTRAFDRRFHEPNRALYLANLARGTRRRLTPPDMHASGPVWTPDGHALYCQGFRSAHYRRADREFIYRLQPDGRRMRQVCPGTSPCP